LSGFARVVRVMRVVRVVRVVRVMRVMRIERDVRVVGHQGHQGHQGCKGYKGYQAERRIHARTEDKDSETASVLARRTTARADKFNSFFLPDILCGTRRPQVATDVGRTQPVISLARRK
jgi:hypothetical protein